MISKAQIIGRSHRLKQQNCQDSVFGAMVTAHTGYGLVLDGCGSNYQEADRVTPSNNEVGAHLLGTFLAGTLHDHLLALQKRSPLSPDDLILVLDGIYQQAVFYLRQQVNLFPFSDDQAMTRFIVTHLLCTVVGFVKLEDTAVAFWQGDGYLRHNDTVHTFDSDDRPDYLAYHLLHLNEADHFHTQTIPIADLTHLAVATDGWSPDLLRQLDTPRNDLLLQRWLNQQARQQPHFDDDGAIAIYYADHGIIG